MVPAELSGSKRIKLRHRCRNEHGELRTRDVSLFTVHYHVLHERGPKQGGRFEPLYLGTVEADNVGQARNGGRGCGC